jgi:DNA polymerase elongation subunit (family B)
MPRIPVAVDIETVGQDWETLPVAVRTYLTDHAKTDAQREEVPGRLALHPGSGRIITIGLWYPDDDRGRVLVEGSPEDWSASDDGTRIFRGPEAVLLREFWQLLSKKPMTVVSFNGRAFDAPYLMIRSAVIGVEPSRNLLPYRYSFKEHCDLLDVLTFWNALRVNGNLEFWCCQFGIESPKAGVHGSDVGALYREGRLEEIASYCLRDARATATLFTRLRPIIRLLDPEVS